MRDRRRFLFALVILSAGSALATEPFFGLRHRDRQAVAFEIAYPDRRTGIGLRRCAAWFMRG
jgi:hypothetical protein